MCAAGLMRAMGIQAHRLLSSTLEVYSGSSFNLLDYLGSCTDGTLFGWIALTRMALVFLMWFSRTVAPALFSATGQSFIFDTGEELYDDARFAMVRHWDGVHMFFIAQYGYLYENQAVFFPGLPGVIRGVQYATKVLVPVLHTLAPVSFYVCVLNVAASCVAGVLLRRFMALTLLGPEAVLQLCWWRRRNPASKLALSTHSSAVTMDEYQRVTEATIQYRLLCGLTGTSLDADDPLMPLPSTTRDVRAKVRRLRRAIGGSVLLWIFTPAMVFTVVVYTESLFALTTILGVYMLAWYEPLPWPLQVKIAACLSPTPATPTSHQRRGESSGDGVSGDAAAKSVPSLDDLLDDLTGGAHSFPNVEWQQAFTTWAEMAAVVLFTLAATLRSNAFTCAGFFAFPIFMQVVLPDVFTSQCRTVLAGQRAAAILAACADGAPGKDVSLQRFTNSTARVAIAPADPPRPRRTKSITCRTLCCPQRRLPHPLRVLILVLECAVLISPYMAINYVGFHRFVVHTWTPQARAQIGTAFWKLYPMLQKKYWNVSFLSAYTFTNLPNVVLALPIAVLVVLCTYNYYLGPAWKVRANVVASSKGKGVPPLSRLSATLVPLVRSSNVVHLLALLTLALSKMHVQVTNRFVMSSPALYYLLGSQLASKPTSLLSQLILMWSIQWSITGGILFANHLPWT